MIPELLIGTSLPQALLDLGNQGLNQNQPRSSCHRSLKSPPSLPQPQMVSRAPHFQSRGHSLIPGAVGHQALGQGGHLAKIHKMDTQLSRRGIGKTNYDSKFQEEVQQAQRYAMDHGRGMTRNILAEEVGQRSLHGKDDF